MKVVKADQQQVPALQISGLTKIYGDRRRWLWRSSQPPTPVIQGLDLTVPAGSFFGLLGPNGAGKSTLLRAIANTVRVTAGSVHIFGEPHHTARARTRLGVAEQEINLDGYSTAEESLLFHGRCFGMTRADARARVRELLERFALEDKLNTRVQELSGGQRRRLLVARALMHRPDLVILDEPTAGVDVEVEDALVRYFRRLHEDGVTLILTTHILELAEEQCDRIALFRAGGVVAVGSPREVCARFGVATIRDAYRAAMGQQP